MDQADCADQGIVWMKEKARPILDVSDIFSILEFSVSCLGFFYGLLPSTILLPNSSVPRLFFFFLSPKDVAQEHDEN